MMILFDYSMVIYFIQQVFSLFITLNLNSVLGNLVKEMNVSENIVQQETLLDLASTTTDLYDSVRVDKLYCTNLSGCYGNDNKLYPDIRCFCDVLCGILDDCCEDFWVDTLPNVTKEQLECTRVSEIIENRNYGVTMVTKCSLEWKDDVTNCEGKPDRHDITSQLPVSNIKELGVMYKNMYCALCNFVNEYEYWKVQLNCHTEISTWSNQSGCIRWYLPPRPEVTRRTCQLRPPVTETCDNDSEGELKRKCENEPFAVVYDLHANIYRNRYCAMCNGREEKDILCENPGIDLYAGSVGNISETSTDLPEATPKATYPYRVLLDYNTETATSKGETQNLIPCGKIKVHACAKKQLTTENLSFENLIGTKLPLNCTLVKLKPGQYSFSQHTASQLIACRIQKNSVYKNGSEMFVCNEALLLDACSKNDPDGPQGYLTLVGLSISIISLSLTLIVYVSFPILLNAPSKMVLCLVVSLLLAQLLFLISGELEDWFRLCAAFGILVHYFYLASFCWMNVIAFDLWQAFSNTCRISQPGFSKSKYVLGYCIYAWIIPFVIVSIVSVFDLAYDSDDIIWQYIKPNYGKWKCWINSKNAILLFFAGPVALFKIFDIIAFVLIITNIARAKQEGARATQRGNGFIFKVSLKLSLVMGLAWAFGLAATLTNETALWYIYTILNSLQGLFIALSFLFTKKVCRLLSAKCKVIYTVNSTDDTEIGPSS